MNNIGTVRSVHSYAGDKKNTDKILFKYIFKILPVVKQELKHWRSEARRGEDQALRNQALSSLDKKDFHCYGGSVFAVTGTEKNLDLIKLIVAYQTICDYLDNLCDRNDCLDGLAFRQLHMALLDAFKPGVARNDYYRYYPNKNDGDYLNKLVDACRTGVEKLPSFNSVYSELIGLVQWYIDLQVYKHISLKQREEMLIKWAGNNLHDYPGLLWQEFAAASGSTLAVFALLSLACKNNIDESSIYNTVKAYFPWICGLHILLDYFIDQEEDREGQDLNFTFYYDNQEMLMDRLKLFIKNSHTLASQLDNPRFDKTVIEGLLAMYLSDSKIRNQGLQPSARSLIGESGGSTWSTYQLCSVVRRFF